jgi:hypothetical protein
MPGPSVAQMTPALAVTAVRSATAHDADTQVTDTQIIAELDREYRRARRWLSSFLPELYQAVAPIYTLAGVADGTVNLLAKPVDFETLVRLEQQFSQGFWQPLTPRPQLHASEGIARDVTGSYRLTYVSRPVDGYTTFDLPPGAEDIMICLVSGWVRNRHEEDSSWHMQRAADLKNELRASLAMRYGAHARSMMTHQYGEGWIGSFYEQGSSIVIV